MLSLQKATKEIYHLQRAKRQQVSVLAPGHQGAMKSFILFSALHESTLCQTQKHCKRNHASHTNRNFRKLACQRLLQRLRHGAGKAGRHEIQTDPPDCRCSTVLLGRMYHAIRDVALHTSTPRGSETMNIDPELCTASLRRVKLLQSAAQQCRF